MCVIFYLQVFTLSVRRLDLIGQIHARNSCINSLTKVRNHG